MRRIGILYGKPVIEGDPNIVTERQILSTTEGGGLVLSERDGSDLNVVTAHGGSVSRYYKYKKVGSYDDVVVDIFNQLLLYISPAITSIVVAGKREAPICLVDDNDGNSSFIPGIFYVTKGGEGYFEVSDSGTMFGMKQPDVSALFDISEGNLYTKISTLYKALEAEDNDFEAVTTVCKKYCTEISKEEFDAAISG